jgi:hypothetical protein
MSRAVEFEQVEKSYGSLSVLKGITGHVNSGEVVAVVGNIWLWQEYAPAVLEPVRNHQQRANSGKWDGFISAKFGPEGVAPAAFSGGHGVSAV